MNNDKYIKKEEADSKIRLTKSERKIYEAIMTAFPATSHESALDKALEGGVNWQFYPK